MVEAVLAVWLFTGGMVPFARTLSEAMQSIEPDAVVADFTWSAPGLVAEQRRLPYANICHTGLMYRGPGIPPFGSGLPIGRAREWGMPRGWRAGLGR